MSGYTLTPDDADYYARILGKVERRIVFLCTRTVSMHYDQMAARIGMDWADVQSAAAHLNARGLIDFRPVRLRNEYSGSAVFLNHRGEAVREAIISRYAWAHNGKPALRSAK